VTRINLATLRLERLDATGGSVGPIRSYSIEDRGNPLDAGINIPFLHVYNPDGFDDIDIGFDIRAVSTLIGCTDLSVGDTSVPLVISGELDDGTEFSSDNADDLLIKNK
jgi:hypothetical protein